MITDEIATTSLVLERDGVTSELRVAIGRPYVVDDVEARCPVKIDGLERQYPDVTGVDTMQALCLAIALVRRRLLDQLDEGGRLTSVEGDAVDHADIAVLFGGSLAPGGG